MTTPSFLQFVISSAQEGGYVAQAIGYSIFTQGATLEETMNNIREATMCHFEEDTSIKPPLPIIANFEIPQFA
jgi:predicted RNase H-like HicB family nuclease